MKEVREFWNSVADIYEKENNDVKVHAIHYQRYLEAVKYLQVSGDRKLLNIWAREGGAIPFLRKANPDFNIFNCELSPELIKRGKKKHPQENFTECSLHHFPFADETFDHVLSLETLEHVPDPILFMKEISRVLKKDGTLVMSTPAATTEYLRRFYELFFSDHGEGPHKFLSSFTVKRLLSEAGLNLSMHKGTVFLPIGVLGIYKLGEWLEPILQFPLAKEWGIRQFYVAVKK